MTLRYMSPGGRSTVPPRPPLGSGRDTRDRSRRHCFFVSDAPNLSSLPKPVSRPPAFRFYFNARPDRGGLGDVLRDEARRSKTSTTVRNHKELSIFVVGPEMEEGHTDRQRCKGKSYSRSV